MTYGEHKRKTLGHIFADTIAGDQILLSYNNQADYVNRIPELTNDAQMYIATKAQGGKRISEAVFLPQLAHENEGEWEVYTLPQDLFQIMNGGLVRMTDRKPLERNQEYFLMTDKLLLPRGRGDGVMLEYWRYPRKLPKNPSDNTELDNTPDVHEILSLYVAAHLVIYDDAFRYSALYNEFHTRLNQLSTPTFVERSHINDVYGFNSFFGVI